MIRPAPSRVASATALLALAVLGLGFTALASAQAGAGPVAGSVRHAYHPGAFGIPSETIKDYDGPLLELQAVKVGKGAAEPTLGVDKDGTAFFAASKLVIDTSFAWGVAQTDVLRSADGGVTWESVQLKVPVAEESIPPGNADPFVWVDPSTGRVFNIDLYAGCSWLNFSDDKGESWVPNPVACGNVVNDHQTIGAGKPPANLVTVGYPNVVYYCFNRIIDSNCGRSLDGGLTWTPTPQPAFFGYDQGKLCGGLHGHLETDPDGRLFLPKGHCGNPWIAISEDGGNSWSRVKVSEMGVNDPHLSVASDTAGNLYFVWWNSQHRQPFMAISRDHGKTWGEPMMIAPPGVAEVNFPVVAAGDPGHVAVSFPSTTQYKASNTRPWDQTVVISTNALDEQPVFLSATANDPADPVHRGACSGRCAGLWDFQDIVVAPDGQVWSAAADDCVGACVQGQAQALHVGEGIAIRQIGGPLLRAATPET